MKIKYYIPSPNIAAKVLAAVFITILFAHYVSASTNVAYGKTPTYAGTCWIGNLPKSLSNIVDNNFTSASNGTSFTFATLGGLCPLPDQNYIQIDLGNTYNISTITIKIGQTHSAGTNTSNATLEISTDNISWTNISLINATGVAETITNNSYIINANARYIRSSIYSSGIWAYYIRWYEIQALYNYHDYQISSSISPKAIFKCQLTNIWANITNNAFPITSVTAWVNSTNRVVTTGGVYQSTQIPYMMVNNSGNWLYQYGNDANLLYGNRTVSFQVTDSTGTYFDQSLSMFTVYSDTCTGTNLQNWSQIPNQGLGHYSARIWQSDGNLLDFALLPWIEYWGYVFYLIIIFAVCLITYMKSQRIIEPILIAFVSLGILASTALPIIPEDFKQYIVMLLGIAVGSLLYKIFKG